MNGKEAIKLFPLKGEICGIYTCLTCSAGVFIGVKSLLLAAPHFFLPECQGVSYTEEFSD